MSRRGAVPGPGGERRARLQRHEAGSGEDSSEADRADDHVANEHLDRLLGDRDMLLRLQLSGYAREYWTPLADVFAQYGLAVLRAWLGTGRIFEEVHRKTGLQLRRPAGRLDQDDIESLASDTIMDALKAFLEKVLKRNRWDPAKGASLKTFFIGQCVLRFPNVYRGWGRERARHLPTESLDRLTNTPAEGDPAGEVLAWEQRAELLASLTTKTARAAAQLREQGYTYAEIAEQLALADEKAVENVFTYQHRLFKQTREHREGA